MFPGYLGYRRRSLISHSISNRARIGIVFLLLSSVCLIVAPSVFGAPKTWDGSTNSNWEIAANWTPPGKPGSGDDVTIANVATPPMLTSATANLGTLTIDPSASFDLAGFGLTVAGALSNSGTIYAEGTESVSATLGVGAGTVEYQANGDGSTDSFVLPYGLRLGR